MNQSTREQQGQGSVLEVFRAFLRLGCTSFGGPIAHLGYFRRELVERRHWVSEDQFGQLLAICQFLPGPASSQLGFGLGLIRAGWFGAFAAFIGFTLPSALLIVGFAHVLPLLTGPIAASALHGLKIVALAVVADAVLGMSKKLCPDGPRASIAVGAAAMIWLAGNAWMQLLVVIAGGLAGSLMSRAESIPTGQQLPIGISAKTGVILLLLFTALLLGLPLLIPMQSPLLGLAEAFYRAGALVFGGGHVVLPLLQDSMVASGRVSGEAFLAGYGAAQAIPGPMFAFAGYLGALAPTGHDIWTGAITALLFMFLPGFLLLGGILPFWRQAAKHPMSGRVIAGVNAAVVGLLAAALYDPIFTSSIRTATDLAIGLLGFSLLAIWRQSALLVVLFCVLASIITGMI